MPTFSVARISVRTITLNGQTTLRHRDSEAQRTATAKPFLLRQQNGFRDGRETEDDKIIVFVVLCFSAFSVLRRRSRQAKTLVVTKKMLAVVVAVL
jgi:hypothetical protein